MKKLHPVKLRVMVKMCAENIAIDLCFPVSTRTKFPLIIFRFYMMMQKLYDANSEV